VNCPKEEKGNPPFKIKNLTSFSNGFSIYHCYPVGERKRNCLANALKIIFYKNQNESYSTIDI
jgi:hypothetical protein